MKRILLFVVAFLCLVTSTIIAQTFPTTYYQNEILLAQNDKQEWFMNRETFFSDEVTFKVPSYNQTPYTGWYAGVYLHDAVPTLKLEFESGTVYTFPSSASITLPFTGGTYNLKLRFVYDWLGADVEITEREVSLQVKEGEPYISPDEVWEFTLSPNEYQPPVDNLYPNNSSLKHYNSPTEKYAIATVTLGEGNTSLTRPLILVDGVVFSHDVILEEGTDRIVRYGSTGWESVVRGLTTGQIGDDEKELFRAYPEIVNRALNNEDSDGLPNYDVILVEFKDGADYIDRCSKLLAKVIDRVNKEKECEFENLIVGLSMGGQVTRFALTEMEAAGKEHHCREYISLDSPHEYATIPLGIQAFIYAAGYIQGNESVKAKFDDLNRPAALMMIKDNIYSEIEKGKLSFTHISDGFAMGDNGIYTNTHNESQIAMYAAPKTIALRTYFEERQDILGYPKYCKNVALAMGSGIGTPLHETDCLLDGHALYDDDQQLDIILSTTILGIPNFAIDAVISNIDDDIAGIKINSIGSAEDLVMEFKFANQNSLTHLFNEVTLRKLADYPNVDVAPGCQRKDLEFLKTEFENSILNDIPSIAALDPVFYCNLPSTVFMPTASVIGVETTDLEMNIKIALENELISSPFDEIFLPTDNLEHVEIKLAGESELNGNDAGSFLFEHLNDNMHDLPGMIVLPSNSMGKSYNYGLYRHRLASFVINKNGALNINHGGLTHFVDSNSESNSNRDDFYVSSFGGVCSEPQTITINKGGQLNLGEVGTLRSGHLVLSSGSELTINEGAQVDLNNNSSLRLLEGSTISINSANALSLAGPTSILILEGHLETTGDVTIQVNGKIIIEPTATFDLGGKLTINGHDVSSDLLSIAGHHTLDQSININNGTITMIADAQLEIISPPSGSQNTVNLQSVILEQEGMHSAFGSRFKFRNLESITIDDFVAKDMPNSIVVDMQQVSSIELSNLNFTNCYKPIQAKNIHQLTLEESQFTSIPVSSTGGNYEGFNGVALSNINTVQLLNCSFDGFGENIGNTDYLYALELIDCPAVDISDSEFVNNKTGINVPQDADQKNNTNLFITNSLFQDNYAGIEMYGYASDAVNIKSSGYLNMECVRMLDNYYGVDGEDILLQADFYFADEQSTANTFRPKNKNEGGGSPVTFHINYTTFSYSDIYLRGNIWYDFDGAEAIVNADGSAANVVKSPGIDGNSGQVELQCASIALDDDCKGCFQQEDDDDCTLKIAEENTNIASIYRDANTAVRNRDFALVEAIFEPLSTIANDSSISGLASKCDYQTHIARVFALPRENDTNWEIGGRSKAEVEYAVVPNPSSESILLEGLPTTDIMIYSSAGQMLMHFEYQEGSTIDISNLPSGLYTIVSANTKSTQRFIVMK